MTDEDFEDQYYLAVSYERRIAEQTACEAWCKTLDALSLWEALVERIEEYMETEECELKAILHEISARLSRLEEKDQVDG